MQEVNTRAKIIRFVLIVIALIILTVKCNSGPNNNLSVKLNDTVKIDTSKSIKQNIPIPNVYYEIITQKNDAQGYINLMYVYVKNKDGINKINPYLVNQYQDNNAHWFQIYYFNNKKIAERYYKKLFEISASDNEIDRLSTHIIGHYEYNKEDGGRLRLGTDAQDL